MKFLGFFLKTLHSIEKISKFVELQVIQVASCSLWQVKGISSCEVVCWCF